MSKLEELKQYFKTLMNKGTMYMPKLWNKYVGFEHYSEVNEHEIKVDEVEFYQYVIDKIYQLKDDTVAKIKDSQIYCAMPRYTMAWDTKNNGDLDNGTLIRMLILLPTLKKMGVNVLYLLPITQYSNRNKKGDIGSPFAIKDFFQLDPNLHDEIVDDMQGFTLDDEFHALIEACHILGIRIVIDFIPRVTARDCNIIKEHPDWVYWIKKDYEKDFLTPEIPGLPFFQECTMDNIEQVYQAQSTKNHLKQFVLPPNQLDSDCWKQILDDVDQKGADLFQLIEERMGITTPPAHSDWINDVQPIWTDITFWKLFMDNNEVASQYVDENQAPYVMFDTIKANKFPAKVPNQELWDLFTNVLEYYTKEFHLDGFRFDIGHTLPKELLQGLFDKVREYVNNPIFISEDLFNRNHMNALKTGYNIILGSSWKEVENIQKDTYETFITELSEMKLQAYACAETHDTPRIVSRDGGVNLARGLAIVNNFLPNGVHFMLSGYAINETQPMNCGLADNTGGAPIPRAFFNNISMDWTSENAEKMLSLVIAVNQIRLELKDMIDPNSLRLLKTSDKCIGFSYADNLIVYFNLDFHESQTFEFDDVLSSGYEEVINSGEEGYQSFISPCKIQLPPAGAVLLRKK